MGLPGQALIHLDNPLVAVDELLADFPQLRRDARVQAHRVHLEDKPAENVGAHQCPQFDGPVRARDDPFLEPLLGGFVHRHGGLQLAGADVVRTSSTNRFSSSLGSPPAAL